jgi:hypothetical protein
MNLATAAASAALSAVNTLLNGGSLIIYSGTMPATPETALSGNTALATFTFSASAFGSNSFSGGNEQATASFTASSVTPSANGTATFARALQSNGTSVVADYTVTATGGGGDITFGTTSFQTTVQAQITSFLHQLPAV